MMQRLMVFLNSLFWTAEKEEELDYMINTLTNKGYVIEIKKKFPDNQDGDNSCIFRVIRPKHKSDASPEIWHNYNHINLYLYIRCIFDREF